MQSREQVAGLDSGRRARSCCRTAWVLFLLCGMLVGVGSRVSGQAPWDERDARSRRGYRGSDLYDQRGGVPDWSVERLHHRDTFTFVRVRYSSYGGRGRRGGDWRTDYPDSDLNFSYRLQQLTSLKVDPDGLILDLDDPRVLDYPFMYLLEPGDMQLSQGEVDGLRRYLLRGGFLMVDDFWGEREWQTFYGQFKRVFPEPEFEPRELPLSHEIFHVVYDLKEKPQIPSIHAWFSGMTTERYDAQEPHYRGVFDKQGRMMSIICHNTDLGDGWEQEGVDPEYFRLFSEKSSYPLGINIVVYAMTH